MRDKKRNFYSCPVCGELNEVNTGEILTGTKPPVLSCKTCGGEQGIPSLIFVELIRDESGVEIYARGLTQIKKAFSLVLENHSPDGFEYGFGGSGPAQAALGILSYFVGIESALYYKHAFKDQIIARLPRDHNYIGLFFDRKIWEVA
jgi:hypothetical protein